MLQVRKELCIGCGQCAINCPQCAIVLYWGKAEIDQRRCINCYRCLQICQQGAIQEEIQITVEPLKDTIANLRHEIDRLIMRIEKLEYKIRK